MTLSTKTTRKKLKPVRAWAIANERGEIFAGTWWLEDQAQAALRGFQNVPSHAKWRVVEVAIFLVKQK